MPEDITGKIARFGNRWCVGFDEEQGGAMAGYDREILVLVVFLVSSALFLFFLHLLHFLSFSFWGFLGFLEFLAHRGVCMFLSVGSGI